MKPMSASLPLPPPPTFSSDWALFLDVDGTLLDFADTPEGVRVAPGLVDALAALQHRLDGALALVSGRPIAQLYRLFAPLQLPAAGLHGLERRGGQPRPGVEPRPPAALETLRQRAEAVTAGFPGALVEDKGLTIALHWRGNPAAAAALRALADVALAELPDYRLQPGDQVLELQPADADKGMAIDALLETRPFRYRLPVFIGDDHTDEHGFEIVLARGGMAVLVGDRQPSIARYRLPDPASVRAWLRDAATSSGTRPETADGDSA